MTKIINGADIARENGCVDHRDFIRRLPNKRHGIPTWNGKETNQDPVVARVDFGRWLADCGCGGAEYVDPGDPIFFCFSCGNADHGGNARRVIFPDSITLVSIEKTLLERPVIERIGKTDSQKAMNSIPALAMLARSWNPGETVKDLKDQHARSKQKAKVK